MSCGLLIFFHVTESLELLGPAQVGHWPKTVSEPPDNLSVCCPAYNMISSHLYSASYCFLTTVWLHVDATIPARGSKIIWCTFLFLMTDSSCLCCVDPNINESLDFFVCLPLFLFWVFVLLVDTDAAVKWGSEFVVGAFIEMWQHICLSNHKRISTPCMHWKYLDHSVLIPPQDKAKMLFPGFMPNLFLTHRGFKSLELFKQTNTPMFWY